MFKFAVTMAAPVFAATHLKEAFYLESNKWYNSHKAQVFNKDAGKNSENFTEDYGLLAKYENTENAISAKLSTPILHD